VLLLDLDLEGVGYGQAEVVCIGGREGWVMLGC
jgi:hypothetical protein